MGKLLRKNKTTAWLLIAAMFLAVVFLLAQKHTSFRPVQAQVSVYYISVNGSDTNAGTSNSPWKNFTFAMTKLKPGDTLILKDGTYYQSLEVTVSGQPGLPIAIKAENDGMAVIDGQSAKQPLKIYQKSYINIEGIVFKNSNGQVISIVGSSNIALKRVSGYNAMIGGNYHVFSISGNSRNILLEDCAASGIGRVMYDLLSSTDITVRRCWGRWIDYSRDPSGISQIYGTNSSILENNVGTMGHNTRLADGIGTWTHTYSKPASRNKVLGNVIYGLNTWTFYDSSAVHRVEDNLFANNVAIDSARGLFQRTTYNLTVDQMTFANIQYNAFSTDPSSSGCFDCDVESSGSVTNSSFYNVDYALTRNSRPITRFGTWEYVNNYPDISTCEEPCGTVYASLSEDWNNFYDFTGMYSGTINKGLNNKSYLPNYNVTKYGKGAYLMVPSSLKGKGKNGKDIGAEVLYRYENGVLTNEPLWPWPMEERIQKETKEILGECISVTWENAGSGCAGGLWKTLDGVYPSICLFPDLDCSDSINFSDFNLFKSYFNTQNITADFNHDQKTNTQDLGIMMGVWGSY